MFELIYAYVTYVAISFLTSSAQAVALSAVLLGYASVFILASSAYLLVMLYAIRAIVNWRDWLQFLN